MDKDKLNPELDEWENEFQSLKNEIVEKKPDETLTTTSFTEALSNNDTAIEMAKQAYKNIGNQEKIAKKIEKVAIDNTNADIEHVEVQVFEKDVNNKVKRQKLKNDLLKLRKEKLFIWREENHKLKMQKLKQRKEKYYELLTRHNKTKIDENGHVSINLPNGFVLFWLIMLDALVQFLNMFSEVFGKLNKVFFKGLFIFFVILMIFIPPFRTWILSLIGIKLGG